MGVWSKLQRLGWAIKYSVVLLYVHLQFLAIGGHSMLQDRITQRRHNKTELPRRSGQVAIVTGGARGIGIKVVQMLLECDMTVIVACRKPEAGQKVIDKIRKSGVTSGRAEVMRFDNADFKVVRGFVAEFTKKYSQLHVLINNAGVMCTPYNETVDGYEEQYGVNYLSHFLLTLLLMPALARAGSTDLGHSRVINVSSCAHLVGDVRFSDTNRKDLFVTAEAYAQSKLAQVLFTKRLARELAAKRLPVQVCAVHPGVVSTDIFRTTYVKYLRAIVDVLFKNLEEGAVPVVYAAVSPLMEKKSGVYVSNCRESRVKAICNDELVQDRLFDLSLRQVGLERLPF
ncbi:retinol dehydrogenase 12-like isoform X3 [Trichogramma pretiosum]|uniref:retinol dehydrogenase 12-like isoform X3 n=1 Tax=Trichogramma pretiosum TaxID=7493 RepID=UPI000C71B638|nr:retinol dehydrogenase 12-like isoform X3 [Trichogramma pretiosum]